MKYYLHNKELELSLVKKPEYYVCFKYDFNEIYVREANKGLCKTLL